MTINVTWATPDQTAIAIEFQRGWAWEDVSAAVRRADDLITSVQHTVHLLIDLRQSGGLPSDFMRAAGDLFAAGDARANEGMKIVVGANRLLQMAYSGFLRVYSHKLQNRPFRFAANMEEAQALLDAERA